MICDSSGMWVLIASDKEYNPPLILVRVIGWAQILRNQAENGTEQTMRARKNIAEIIIYETLVQIFSQVGTLASMILGNHTGNFCCEVWNCINIIQYYIYRSNRLLIHFYNLKSKPFYIFPPSFFPCPFFHFPLS